MPKVLPYATLMDQVLTKQKAAIAMFTFTHEPCSGTRLEVEKGKTVFCEALNFDHKPGLANYKLPCSQVMEKGEVQVFRIS